MPRTFRSGGLTGGVFAAGSPTATVPQLKICLAGTPYCIGVAPFAAREFDPELYRRQVAELKADLSGALAELQAHEKDIAGLVKEGSRLAITELEEALNDALRELEQRKRRRGE